MIGGLVVSTFVTLFIVPSVFALLMGKKTPRSPSLHPDDPESSHYAPDGQPARIGGPRGIRSDSHPPPQEDHP